MIEWIYLLFYILAMISFFIGFYEKSAVNKKSEFMATFIISLLWPISLAVILGMAVKLLLKIIENDVRN